MKNRLSGFFPLIYAVSCFILSCMVTQAASADISAEHSVSEWTNTPVVRIVSGSLKGYRDKESTWTWKGVPYAEPPVGPLRWKPPKDLEPWTGTIKAKRFGPMCVQYKPIAEKQITGSEDCLYLNIWRPQTAETGLPVYL